MPVTSSSPASGTAPADLDAQHELLDCLQKLGGTMLAASSPIGKVKNTLEDIAQVFGYESDIVALPNVLLLKLGNAETASLDITTQHIASLQLDQASDLAQLVDRLLLRSVTPAEASLQLDRILLRRPRFSTPLILLGYLLAVVGLSLRIYPRPDLVLISAGLGLVAGLILIGAERFPRYRLFAPILAALAVSIPTFLLAESGYIRGTASLIVPPLLGFLPGAILTTAMIDLASTDIISGSSRLIYGFASLLLLYVGIGAASVFVGSSSTAVTEMPQVDIPAWAGILGTALFGIGNFIRLSGRNKDLLWILLVLYLAFAGQLIGETYINNYFGAFLGAVVLAVSSELIARAPNRTPAFVSQMLAFWFLVPGSRALLSVTQLLDANFLVGSFGLADLILLIVAVSLGILLGTILVTPGPKRSPAG